MRSQRTSSLAGREFTPAEGEGQSAATGPAFTLYILGNHILHEAGTVTLPIRFSIG